MNYSTAIFLISDKVRAVSAAFETDKEGNPVEGKTYVYKTMDPDIKVDDFIIVESKSRFKMAVVKVIEVDVEPDFDSHIDYKWVIGSIDIVNAELIAKQEEEAIIHIKKAEKRKRREELRKDLIAEANGDLTSLPIYSHKEEEKETLTNDKAEKTTG